MRTSGGEVKTFAIVGSLWYHWRRAARKRACRTSPSFARVCSLYNNIRTPGQLQPTATFYLFKDHIEPKWEDPKNTNGGCWTASVPNKGQNTKGQLDAWWLHGVRSWEVARGATACDACPMAQVFGLGCMAHRLHGVILTRASFITLPPGTGLGLHRRAVHRGRGGLRHRR